MKNFRIIAFTHKLTDINDIGKLHIEESEQKERLHYLKNKLQLNELLYLSTCNRVEFLLINDEVITTSFLRNFFTAFNPQWTEEDIEWAMAGAQVFEGKEAIKHLFSVASSIDSLVVGEREIITQVRNSFERCNEMGLTSDFIRLITNSTIKVAKEVYTHTAIANNPVSVVSLAYRKLRALNVSQNARFLIIGAGVTNASMANYLKKHQFANFTVFNRTIAKAEILASELNGKAFPLTDLENYSKGFDIIVTCTGASESIITPTIYKQLVGNDTDKKIVIDLAIPNDLDAEIVKNHNINFISITQLQEIAKENMAAREKELVACHTIIDNNIIEFEQALKARKVELAMKEVPKKVKEIRETANEVFAAELTELDETSKAILEKMTAYMEKKYISIPMKMAKDILLEVPRK